MMYYIYTHISINIYIYIYNVCAVHIYAIYAIYATYIIYNIIYMERERYFAYIMG